MSLGISWGKGVSWGMEVEGTSSDGSTVSLASFFGGWGRVGKSQGRGTYTFQLVSKTLYGQPRLEILPRLQA